MAPSQQTCNEKAGKKIVPGRKVVRASPRAAAKGRKPGEGSESEKGNKEKHEVTMERGWYVLIYRKRRNAAIVTMETSEIKHASLFSDAGLATGRSNEGTGQCVYSNKLTL